MVVTKIQYFEKFNIFLKGTPQLETKLKIILVLQFCKTTYKLLISMFASSFRSIARTVKSFYRGLAYRIFHVALIVPNLLNYPQTFATTTGTMRITR
jgi:hypothetical protein